MHPVHHEPIAHEASPPSAAGSGIDGDTSPVL
jgi:hypothetical protein